MGALGMQQFMRQFYAQANKDAMILDDRWNGGLGFDVLGERRSSGF
jgi:tricorn protease